MEMYYFAYGSNMNLGDLERWCEEKNYPPIEPLSVEPGILRRYRLDFNYYSHTRGGGALNIMSHAGDKVYGVVFELTQDDFDKIKEKEGPSYKSIPVNIDVSDGTRGARTFKVRKEEESGPHKPTSKYLQVVLEGVKCFGFSEDCRKKIKQAAKRAEIVEESLK